MTAKSKLLPVFGGLFLSFFILIIVSAFFMLSARRNLVVEGEKKMKSFVPVALILLLLVLGCGQLKNNISRSSSSFNPYQGSLSNLLKPEISGLVVTFKLSGTRDLISQHPGATEAKGFTYLQDAAGVSVEVDGLLVNYPSAEKAETRLRAIAAEVGATVVKKGKWQRFNTEDGETIGWTNGSVMCLVKSTFAKPAGNFEDSAPF